MSIKKEDAIDQLETTINQWFDSVRESAQKLRVINAELDAASDLQFKRLIAYADAINRIDDYFEYTSESKKDRTKVYKILSELTNELTKITKGGTIASSNK